MTNIVQCVVGVYCKLEKGYDSYIATATVKLTTPVVRVKGHDTKSIGLCWISRIYLKIILAITDKNQRQIQHLICQFLFRIIDSFDLFLRSFLQILFFAQESKCLTGFKSLKSVFRHYQLCCVQNWLISILCSISFVPLKGNNEKIEKSSFRSLEHYYFLSTHTRQRSSWWTRFRGIFAEGIRDYKYFRWKCIVL